MTTSDNGSTPRASSQLALFNVDEYNDHRPLPEIIASKWSFALQQQDVDDRRYYAVQDWIAGLSQGNTERAADIWRKLKQRIQKADIETRPQWSGLKYRATDGKSYKRDFATSESLYLIAQRLDANSGICAKVLAYLAKSGVLIDEYRRDPEKMVNAAIAAYQKQGKDDEWIETRFKTVADRKTFADSMAKHITDLIPAIHYAAATNLVSEGLWGRDVPSLRAEMGIKGKQTPRDFQPRQGLLYNSLVETTIADIFAKYDHLEWVDAAPIIKEVSGVFGVQADQLGRLLGIDLATGKKLLKGGQ